MKTLYIHIGTPKTGTSSIQRTLWSNEEALRSENAVYPHIEEFRSAVIGMRRNGAFLSAEHRKDGDRIIRVEDSWRDRVLDRVVSLFETYDTVILSDEGMWHRTAVAGAHSIWDRIRTSSTEHGYRVIVIVYLRPQIEYKSSQWNQRVKVANYRTSSRETWGDAVRHERSETDLDYYRILEDIREIMGRENMIVRRFDRASMEGGDVTKDFLHLLGMDIHNGFEALEDEVNDSLRGNTHEIKRITNSFFNTNTPDEKWIREQLLSISDESNRRYPTKVYTKEEAQAYAEAFADGNDRIALEYIGDGKPLFRPVDRDLHVWNRDNAYMIDDVIAYATVMNIGLKHQIEEAERRNEELKSTVTELQASVKELRNRKIGLRAVLKNTFRSIRK